MNFRYTKDPYGKLLRLNTQEVGVLPKQPKRRRNSGDMKNVVLTSMDFTSNPTN